MYFSKIGILALNNKFVEKKKQSITKININQLIEFKYYVRIEFSIHFNEFLIVLSIYFDQNLSNFH
jgi:hypothetical protein